MLLSELTQYLNSLLSVEQYRDYCPNGVQVTGCAEVNKIVTGVTACQQLLDAAVLANADAVLVHHGYFWKGEDPCITGIKRDRIATLINNDMSLLAYHLPLDAHPVLGNNAQLAKVLNFEVDQIEQDGLLYIGHLSQAQSLANLASNITTNLQRQPQVIDARQQPITTIAWCTGAAQDLIVDVAQLGVDAFLSGETSERTFHYAQEYQIDYICAGHHATEMFGIKALGEQLTKQCDVEVEYINITNPV